MNVLHHNVVDGVVNQRHLEKVVRSLYPNEQISINDRYEIKNPSTGNLLEVDLWIPSLHLCFEFQDIYHYSAVFYSPITLQTIQTRDNLKKEQLHERKETLVVVPYWWAGDSESLQATIEFFRPDLNPQLGILNDSSSIISFNPKFNQDSDVVPGIGSLMLASFLEYEVLPNISGPDWWSGEKYDGIRFCWHPTHQIVYSRRGISLSIPPEIRRCFLDNTFIDGEFWSGRGKYQEATRLIYTLPNLNMALSKFIAFDVPNWNMRKETYENRYSSLLSLIPSQHPILILPGRVICDSTELLIDLLRNVQEFGGEGIILYHLNSVYSPGRSNLLFKIKTSSGVDSEALVVNVDDDAVTLRLPRGETFTVSHPSTSTTSTNTQIKREIKREMIKRGSVVTVSYERLTQANQPVKPVILSVREDVTWEQVLAKFNVLPASAAVGKAKKRVISEHDRLGGAKVSSKSKRFWRDKQNQRKYIIKLAKQVGFDPLIAKDWRSVYPVIAQKLSAHQIIKYYGKSVAKTLKHLFPDIGLTPSDLVIKQVPNSELRKRLIDFAKSKGIDPLVPDNWYNFRFRSYDSNSQIRSLLLYGHTWIKLVKNSFPELQLDEGKFLHNKAKRPSAHWQETKNQREFFIQFAKRKGFDPLVAKNWYPIQPAQIKRIKQGKKVLAHFGGRYLAALHALFPNIGLYRSQDGLKEKNDIEEKRKQKI